MGLKDFMKERKNNIDKRKAIENKVVAKIVCSVDRGANYIFTRNFVMSKTESGDVYINSLHKVKIMSCEDYNESYITKSTTKKLLGAATGGLLTGGAGAIVGAFAVGNNRKVNNKFDKLVAIDDYGTIHEVILKDVFLQRHMIETYIYKGES